MKTPPINMKFPFAIPPGEDGVKLRPREWNLLLYLLEHRGEVVTAEDIYRDVYRLHPSAWPSRPSGIFSQLARLRDNAPFVLIARLREIGWVLV